MKAVILAAGLGERLRPMTDDRPKAMVPLGDRPLVAYTLDALRRVGLTEIAVVGGYCAPILTDWLAAHAPTVTTLYNADFAQGSILTVRAARNFCGDDGFVLCNADHIFHPHIWELATQPAATMTALCDFDRELAHDDMKVATDQRQRVTAIHKQLTTFDGGYIGLTQVPAAASAAYWHALASTQRANGDTASAEWIVGHAIAHGAPVAVRDASGYGWTEIDHPDELSRAADFVQQLAA